MNANPPGRSARRGDSGLPSSRQSRPGRPRVQASLLGCGVVSSLLPHERGNLRHREDLAPEKIAEGVWRLSLYGANVYFVWAEAGWVLVDAAWAWGSCGRAIRRGAEALFGPGVPPSAILLTHLHPDHDGAALELAKAWSCPVYVHADELPLARAVATGDLAGIERYGNGLDRAVIAPLLRAVRAVWPRAAAAPARESLGDVAQVLDPAEVPGLSDWTWVPTPGHAPGHIAFFRRRDRVLLSGDAVLTVDASSLAGWLAWAHGTRPPHACEPPGYTNWDQATTDASLAVLAALEPCVLASGHGAPLVGDAAVRDLRALAERSAARQRTPPAL